MALYELTILVDINENALAAHDGDEGPPPNNVSDWYSTDVELAYQKGWLSFEYEDLSFVKRL